MAEIPDTTNVSLLKNVSGSNHLTDIGTRGINNEELKISEWLNELSLKEQNKEWAEQVNTRREKHKKKTTKMKKIKHSQSSGHKPTKCMLLISGNEIGKINRRLGTVA